MQFVTTSLPCFISEFCTQLLHNAASHSFCFLNGLCVFFPHPALLPVYINSEGSREAKGGKKRILENVFRLGCKLEFEQ